jgi:hypothetical protein
MKIPAACLTLLLLALAIQTTLAQDITGYQLHDGNVGDSVSRYIKKLTQNKVDTFIRFDLPESHPYRNPETDLFDYQHPNTSFLFYRRDNKTYVTKYNWSEKYQSMWDPIEVPGDTLFAWLACNQEELTNNEINPFIYRIQEYDSLARYLPWKAPYAPSYFIEYYAHGNSIYNRFTTDSFEKRNRHGLINLNYEYNTNTILFHLFLVLEVYCTKVFYMVE